MTAKNMAILGLVLSFLVSPAGIIVSAIAMKKMKEEGNEDGKGLAVAGLVLGIIFTVVYVIIVGCVSCAGCALAGMAGSY